jgi:hypothetical protein
MRPIERPLLSALLRWAYAPAPYLTVACRVGIAAYDLYASSARVPNRVGPNR